MTHAVKRLWMVMILLAAWTAGVAAQEFPDPVGHVNDFAGVMSPGAVASLESELTAFDEKTGVEIAVVTVPDLGGLDEATYAVDLFGRWGIGSKDRDDGLLILVAVKERRLRIEVGYGLEPIITDFQSGVIRDQYMTPALSRDDWDTGLTQGALAAAAIIARERGLALDDIITGPVPQQVAPPTRRPGGDSPVAPILFVIILLFLISTRTGRRLLTFMVIMNLMGGGRRRYGGFGGGFGGGGFGGGGFGGFGGGMSGGGGASGGF